MPTNVKLFLGLYGASIAISVVGLASVFAVASRFGLSPAQLGLVITLPIMKIIAAGALTALAGFWRQNWARVVLVVLFVLGLALMAQSTVALRHLALVPMITILAQIALQAGGLAMVFSAGARPWFEPGNATPENVF